jgi:hypothetical protein
MTENITSDLSNTPFLLMAPFALASVLHVLLFMKHQAFAVYIPIKTFNVKLFGMAMKSLTIYGI